jgi:hypothetical protein
MFTDAVASKYKGTEGLLFISDIRSADWASMTNKQVEAEVIEDMEAQKQWHLIMKPLASEFKFRPPWGSGNTDYFKGDIYFPIWGPVTTTEGRLICRGDAPFVSYNNTTYEEEMFFFNTLQRVSLYDHDCGSDRWPHSQYDHCYDCMAEISVLREHFRINSKRMGIDWEAMSAAKQCRNVIQMSIDMNCVATNRTLRDNNPDPGDRKRKIIRRQFVDGKPAYVTEADRKGMSVKDAMRETEQSASQFDAHDEAQTHHRDYKEVGARMAPNLVDGRGLGKNRQGIKQPIDVQNQNHRAGLGFGVRHYVPHIDRHRQNFVQTSKRAREDNHDDEPHRSPH